MSRRLRWLGDAALLALIVALGGGGSWLAHRSLREAAQAQQREREAAIGQSVVSALDLELLRVAEALRAAGQMLAAMPDLSRPQFKRYADGLLGDLSLISLFEWQPLVRAAERARFELAAQRQQPGFRLQEPRGEGFVPAEPRPEHLPVLYSWPDEDAAAVGVDMGFDPRRMRSKWLARDAGDPVASETFEIIRRQQDGEPVRGFAISAPVYREGVKPDSAAQRRALLAGYVAGVIELPVLMHEAALRAESNGFHSWVLDTEGTERRVIYASQGDAAMAGFQPQAQDLRLVVVVGTRPWELVLRPQSSAPAPAAQLPVLVLGLGLLATTVVLVAVARSLRIRRRLQRTEAELAADRQRLTHVLEGTAAGTWEWHVPTGALLVNERWAQMLGRELVSLQPVTADTWRALCHPEDLPKALQQLERHLAGELDFYEGEFRMRHLDGSWVWVSSRGRLFEHDGQGQPLRMAGTHLCIADRMADRQRLQEHTEALELANRRLHELSIVDALTGAFNRRHFNEVCRSSLSQLPRGQAIALCMLDIDHFKAYNDHYGHALGDAVLRQVAYCLRQTLKRASDALFRLGGEEFGVIFSATSAETAERFVQDLCAAVSALNLPHERSPLGRVTASFGLAWWASAGPELTPEMLYAEADKALYEAKDQGRNRVVMRQAGV